MDLRQIAMSSADVCLKYYEKNPKAAVFKTNIRAIQSTLLEDEFELTLESKLRPSEDLTIRIGKDKCFANSTDQKHYRIQSIIGKKAVLCEVSKELADTLREIEGKDIDNKIDCWFESDKTFLVKQVKEWYKNHGNKIKIPNFVPSVPVSFHPQIRISENQKEAVKTVLTSPFSYIWGAPGTGKTRHVLATCLYSCLRAKKKVLLTAPTNVALDQSLNGILEVLEKDSELNIREQVLRLGIPEDQFFNKLADVCAEAVFRRLIKQCQERITEILNTLPKLKISKDIKSGVAQGIDPFPGMSGREVEEQIRQLNQEKTKLSAKRDEATEKNSLSPFMDDFDIIAATADSCIFNIKPDGVFSPDHIFLDEAGYCSVIKGMTYTAFNCPFTMLGDHMQLPPVCDVEPKPKDEITEEEKNTLFLWKFSSIAAEEVIQARDYARFKDKDDIDLSFQQLKKISLTETHRFGPKLAKILAEQVYDSNFTSRREKETDIWVINAPKRAKDIGKDPQTGNRIRFSQSEEAAIIRLILNNIGSESIENIGILTPYTYHRKQLSHDIGEQLKSHHYHNIVRDRIMSIHQSQGSEWDVVIISAVDSMVFGDAWYMNTAKGGASNAIKIINTAVSRARQLLILVCDIASWQQHPNQFLSKIIEIAKEHEPEDPLPILNEAKGEQP